MGPGRTSEVPINDIILRARVTRSEDKRGVRSCVFLRNERAADLLVLTQKLSCTAVPR